MRTRKELETNRIGLSKVEYDEELQAQILEVLLDCRDELIKMNK